MPEYNVFYRALRRDIRDSWLGRYFRPKPTMLQLLVDDVCSSPYERGHRWQRDRDDELPLEVLGALLRESVLSKIQLVQISAGERIQPPDLPQIGQVLIDSLPQLSSVQLVTNVFHPQVIISGLVSLAKGIEAAGIHFSVCVPLDGVADNRNLNLVLAGKFVSAVELIKALRKNGIPFCVDYLLTRTNCHHADDVLIWCEQNGIQDWSFRLGAEIKKGHRDGDRQQHALTAEQRFHAILFFDKLTHYRGVDSARRRFYASLADQLADGQSRQVEFDGHGRGISLDMAGNLRLVSGQIDRCEQDITDPPRMGELVRRGIVAFTRPYQRRKDRLHSWSGSTKSILLADRNSPHEWRHVLITGWYGTETTGDKAILAEVHHFLSTYAPDCQITLTSIDRKISQQTQRELEGLTGVALVDIAEAHDPALIESVDAVIIGGGPLMETTQMEHVWHIFAEANRRRKARIVFGCGVGPLYSERYKQITGDILRMTTAGFLRDEESHSSAGKLCPDHSLTYACDPSLAFLQRWVCDSRRPVWQRYGPIRIAALLRANTKEFVADQTNSELGDANAWAANQIARILEYVSIQNQAEAELLPMNSHWLGGDDRIFNRCVAGFFKRSEAVQIERRYLPMEALLQALNLADAAVAMRYHGHLFCMALGIPFLSIDYAGRPGKVHSLIQRIGYGEFSEQWRSIDVDHAQKRFQRLLDERDYWSAFLKLQADRLVDKLHHTYTHVFRLHGVRSPFEGH